MGNVLKPRKEIIYLTCLPQCFQYYNTSLKEISWFEMLYLGRHKMFISNKEYTDIQCIGKPLRQAKKL